MRYRAMLPTFLPDCSGCCAQAACNTSHSGDRFAQLSQLTPDYTATPLVFPASDAVFNYSLGYVRLFTFDFLPKQSIIRFPCARRPRIAGCPW